MKLTMKRLITTGLPLLKQQQPITRRQICSNVVVVSQLAKSNHFAVTSLESVGTCCVKLWQQQRRHLSSTDSGSKRKRPDPFARRPTAKCDPYGQGGKPLPIWEANALLATIDPRWKLEESKDDETPQALVREFVHPDFIAGSKFVTKVAAVAQLNIHFPSIQLERRIVPRQKEWQVVTEIRCHTLVLGGLSTHDFHLAMLIDVEANRPEVKELILPPEEESS